MSDALRQIAAEMLRGAHTCEKGHRAGKSEHVHFDDVHAWGRRLAILASQPEPAVTEAQEGDTWTTDFHRKIGAVLKDHWNHTGYGEPECFDGEGAITDWYSRASLFDLDCPACEALYAMRSAWLGYRSEAEARAASPSPAPAAEPSTDGAEIAYRLDATLSEAAMSGYVVSLDARNRADLAKVLEGTGWVLARAASPSPAVAPLDAADRALSVPHREDEQACGCDDCMAYGAEDIGADWHRLSPARRIALRVLDSGDDRFAPLVTAIREHDAAYAEASEQAASPGEGEPADA